MNMVEDRYRAKRGGLGLATRTKLHAVNQPVAHGCDEGHDYLMGYGAAKPFTLPTRLFMPNMAGSLGTPGEAQRSRAIRLEALYVRAFRIGVAVILALGALWAINAPRSRTPAPHTSTADYLAKARHLAPGQSAYEIDPHEGCLVFMHKDLSGLPLVSSHC